MTDLTTLGTISSTAAHLRTTYRTASTIYHDAEQKRSDEHAKGIEYGSPFTREPVGQSQKDCGKLHAERMNLIDLLRKCSPEAVTAFPIVMSPGSWHLHGVDWDKAEAQLLAVQLSADAAIANMNAFDKR